MKNTAVLLMLLLSAVGYAAPTDEAQIKTTLIEMWAALEEGDIEQYAKYVHPAYTVFGESDLYLAEGKALELRNMTDWVGRAKQVHTEMHDAAVTVRGDTAWVTYYWTDAGYTDEGRFTSRGKSTRIFVREDGRWLCIHGHFTAVD
ncbi:MAG: nuclear transport factor 2 family protein [Pseudomonadota bacterium]